MDEHEQRESAEAQIAHDADKLELVLQSREYHVQGGYDTSEWLRNSVEGLKTPFARQLAELACRVSPERWWKAVRDLHRDDRPASGE